MNKHTNFSAGENRMIHFSPMNTPENTFPQNSGKENNDGFKDHVEVDYNLQTGEGGTMDLYEEHYTKKVDAVSTEISDLLKAIRENSSDNTADDLQSKQKKWTDYYVQLKDWMIQNKEKTRMARKRFDDGMAGAELVLEKLDGIAREARTEAGNKDALPSYKEKMANEWEEEALETMKIDGQASESSDMYILDIPQTWKVLSDGIVETRPEEDSRPVASGRNRIYLKSSVSEFEVETSEGKKKVVVERPIVAPLPKQIEQVNQQEWNIDVPDGGSVDIKFDTYPAWSSFSANSVSVKSQDYQMKRLSNGKVQVKTRLEFEYRVKNANGEIVDETSQKTKEPDPVFRIENPPKKQVEQKESPEEVFFRKVTEYLEAVRSTYENSGEEGALDLLNGYLQENEAMAKDVKNGPTLKSYAEGIVKETAEGTFLLQYDVENGQYVLQEQIEDYDEDALIEEVQGMVDAIKTGLDTGVYIENINFTVTALNKILNNTNIDLSGDKVSNAFYGMQSNEIVAANGEKFALLFNGNEFTLDPIEIVEVATLSDKAEIVKDVVKNVAISTEEVKTDESVEIVEKQEIDIEVNEEKNEAHESLTKLTEMTKKFVDSGTRFFTDLESTIYTYTEKGALENIDLKNADEQLPKQAAGLINEGLGRYANIDPHAYNVEWNPEKDTIRITTKKFQGKEETEDVLNLRAELNEVSPNSVQTEADNSGNLTLVVSNTKSFTKDTLPALRKEAELGLTAGERQKVDKEIERDNKYNAYKKLQSALFGEVIFKNGTTSTPSVKAMAQNIVSALDSKDHNVYLSGNDLYENDREGVFGMDHRVAKGFRQIVLEDPVEALKMVHSVNESNSNYATTTKKVIVSAGKELDNYRSDKLETHEDLYKRQSVVFENMNELRSDLASGVTLSKNKVKTINTMLQKLRRIDRRFFATHFEQYLRPSIISPDEKTLYRFEYYPANNTLIVHQDAITKNGPVRLKDSRDEQPITPEFAPENHSEELTKQFRKAMEDIPSEDQVYYEQFIKAMNVVMNEDGSYNLEWHIDEGKAGYYPMVADVMQSKGVYKNEAFIYENISEEDVRNIIKRIK